MIDFTLETQIDRAPTDVFAYVTDPNQLPEWQTNTVSSVAEGGGPVALGTRLREVHRAPGGKQVESLVEVDEYEPGRAFGLHVVEGTPVHLRITLEPAAGGTLLRFRGHGRLTGGLRLVQPLLGRVLRRQFAGQLGTLKRVLEAAPA
jgi:uncharacterized protein YndB with AHSA1/START domain